VRMAPSSSRKGSALVFSSSMPASSAHIERAACTPGS
jgi:hypothetical protein